MAKVTGPVLGVWDTDSARLVGLVQNGGAVDPTYLAGQDTEIPAGAFPALGLADPVTGVIENFSGGQKIGPLKRRLARSLIGARSVFHGAGFTAIGAAYTIAHECEAPAPFDFIRAKCVNGGSSAYTLGNIKFAAAANFGDDGAALTWVQGSFSASGENSKPPATAATPTSFSVPAKVSGTGSNVVPGIAFSDWAQVSSLDRADGGVNHIGQCRVALPSGANVISVSGANEAAVFDAKAAASGLRFRSSLGAGDNVTTIAAQACVANNGWFGIQGLEFLHRSAAVQISEFGDSTQRGQGWTDQNTGHISPGFLAQASLSSQSNPVFYENHCVSGQNSASSRATAKWHIANGTLDVVIIPSWSANDGGSAVLSQWPDIAVTVNFALSYGVLPVVVDAMPEYTLTLAQDNERKVLNARLDALRSIGAMVIKRDVVMTDNGAPARQIASLTNEGRHPNAAGYGLIYPQYVDVFKEIQAAA